MNTFHPSREMLGSYDHIIVAFSGGKDSLACTLDLIERGASKAKIELWHHDVDGREGSKLMDWPCTRGYCEKVAEALDLTLYFSWKVGGFEREMLRDGTRTAPTAFETPSGLRYAGGDRGKGGTRMKFPQVSADLSVRWCSSYLKIDVGSKALSNQERFDGKRVLFVTGERAEESKSPTSGRATYASFEHHRADLRNGRTPRHVDHWRPVHAWPEAKVWETIQRHGILPHPAYRLGWGRVSCVSCIFGSPNQWASLRAIDPDRVKRIADYEVAFGKTIHRKLSVIQSADKGVPYTMTDADILSAINPDFCENVLVDPEHEWELPAGAFGESCGPT